MRKLCVSVTEPTLEGARRAVDDALAAGAMAEVRLDWISEPLPADPSALAAVFGTAGRDAIATFRRPVDGGRRELEDDTRLRLLAGCSRALGVYCDLELELAGRFAAAAPDPELLVLSHHDFGGTPDLGALYDEMTRVPAAVYKVATLARDAADVAAHFALLGLAARDGRRLVSVAMGPAGAPTRILGPAFGSTFSFCAAGPGRESAPGQATLAEMRDLYRAHLATPDWMVTGLVAARTGYSRSPAMHNRAFAALGPDGVYVPFDVADLPAFVSAVLRPASRAVPWRVRGVSVTNPFKTEVVGLLDAVDELAGRAGAVNTVVVEGGRLVGYNTDVEGSMRPLERAAGALRGRRVAVVGAGGAARAVAVGLAGRGADVSVFARDAAKAAEVARVGGGRGLSLDAVGDARRGPFDVLVNATPLGTEGPQEGESPVPARALEGVGLVYDLVYAPSETKLLREAAAAGCQVLGGLPMLAEQAALQFELWTGVRVPPDFMLGAAAAAP